MPAIYTGVSHAQRKKKKKNKRLNKQKGMSQQVERPLPSQTGAAMMILLSRGC